MEDSREARCHWTCKDQEEARGMHGVEVHRLGILPGSSSMATTNQDGKKIVYSTRHVDLAAFSASLWACCFFSLSTSSCMSSLAMAILFRMPLYSPRSDVTRSLEMPT